MSTEADRLVLENAAATGEQRPAVRTRKPDRTQHVMLWCDLDAALPGEHQARVIWAAVGTLDLSAFYQPIKARQGTAGRDPIDPTVLIALWLLAYSEGIGSGRLVARLAEEHLAYRWVCGGVGVNYHTLNDFRTGFAAALDDLFTQVLGRLMHRGLISVQRITQDGTKVRASAAAASFKAKPSLRASLDEARLHVAELGRLADESPADAAARQRANQQRVAEDRLGRVRRAMEAVDQVQAAKDQQKDKPSRKRPAKASTSDPDARVMRMPDGGYRPAYNLQVAQDPHSRAIVGVAVCSEGNDSGQGRPMREQVEARTGQAVAEHVHDGGFLRLEALDEAAAAGVTVYAPVPKPRKAGQDRFQPRRDDSEAVAQWRRRMATPEARAVYAQRAGVCETVNADLKTHRGLDRLPVRGTGKVLCVLLWSALAYNLMLFGRALLIG